MRCLFSFQVINQLVGMCDLRITGEKKWTVLISKCKNVIGRWWISCVPFPSAPWKSLSMSTSFISIFVHKRIQGCSDVFPLNNYNSLYEYIWHALSIIAALTLPSCQGNRHHHHLGSSEKKSVKEQKCIVYCRVRVSLSEGEFDEFPILMNWTQTHCKA